MRILCLNLLLESFGFTRVFSLFMKIRTPLYIISAWLKQQLAKRSVFSTTSDLRTRHRHCRLASFMLSNKNAANQRRR